ncbi:MAG: hypothetical protein HYU69_08485 [Bacteroidetes bacterium]|nr:hypothetical protein [Bacteroidota bacterium]
MELTSITIGEITVMEPVTTITDLIVSAVCFYAFGKLGKSENSRHISIKLYQYFFLTMGLATAFGGLIGHAFLHYLGFEWKLPGWIISMLSVALAERGAIIHARPLLKKRIGDFFVVINIVELLAFIFLAMYALKFIYVEIHAVYGLLVILFSFELFVYKKTEDKGSRIALWSVFFAFLAAFTHLIKISIHKWFNYLDLSHVFMAVSSYILYRGVISMNIYEKGKQSS